MTRPSRRVHRVLFLWLGKGVFLETWLIFFRHTRQETNKSQLEKKNSGTSQFSYHIYLVPRPRPVRSYLLRDELLLQWSSLNSLVIRSPPSPSHFVCVSVCECEGRDSTTPKTKNNKKRKWFKKKPKGNQDLFLQVTCTSLSLKELRASD